MANLVKIAGALQRLYKIGPGPLSQSEAQQVVDKFKALPHIEKTSAKLDQIMKEVVPSKLNFSTAGLDMSDVNSLQQQILMLLAE